LVLGGVFSHQFVYLFGQIALGFPVLAETSHDACFLGLREGSGLEVLETELQTSDLEYTFTSCVRRMLSQQIQF
jgi:hypothetical protein